MEAYVWLAKALFNTKLKNNTKLKKNNTKLKKHNTKLKKQKYLVKKIILSEKAILRQKNPTKLRNSNTD